MVSYIMDHSKPASNNPYHFRCSLESFNETYNIMKCLNAVEGVQKITISSSQKTTRAFSIQTEVQPTFSKDDLFKY